jgi:sulfur carrier protein ThiS
MANYLNKEGILYTQEEIEAAALENNVDVDTILADNELSLEGEKPGKKQSVVVKKPTTAQEKSKSVSPSGNTSSGWNTKTKPKTMGEQIVSTFQEEKKNQPKPVDFKAAKQRLAAQAGEVDPSSVPGSFGYKTFKATKKKEEEKAKQLEEEKIAFEARTASTSLRNNDEAKKWFEDAKEAAKLTDEETVGLDEFINLEIAKNGQIERVDTSEGKNKALISKGGFSGEPEGVVDQPYQAFPEQVKKIKTQLKSENLLNKFSEDEILQKAAGLWKVENAKKIQESKFRDALEDTTNISQTAKEIVNNYTVKTKGKEELDYVKNTIFKEGLDKSVEKNINDVNKIDEQLKPKGYKFQTQDEINTQNDLITKRNTLIKDLEDLSELKNETSKKIVASSKNIDDLNLQSDMFSRDYSYSGVGKKIATNFKMMANDLLGFASYTYQPTEMVYDALNIKEITGIANPFTAINTALSENKARYEEELTYNYAKPREGGLEANFEKVGDLVITQAPNLALMILTKGGSVAEQAAAKTSQSLLARAGKFTKDYLTLGRQTGAMAAVATGSKYLDMVNEERNGYYTEDGVFVKPNYNAMQLIVAPAAFGYVEGIFEKSTGKILEKGKNFLVSAAKKEPMKWFDFEVATGKKFAKQAGINLGGAYAEEIPSEVFTTVGHNILDKFALGKEVNLLDNTGATIKDTGILTSVLAGAPLIGGAIIRPFMSRTTAQKLSDNARGLAAILHELEFNKDLSNVQQEALVKKESVLKAESTTLLEKTISDIDAMPIDTFNSINKSVSKMADFINKANTINESDSESKETDLNVLKTNYVIEQTKLNTLTSGIENVKTFGQPLSPISRAQLIDLNSKRVETSFNPDLNEDEKKTMLKKIELQTKNIYKKEGIDLGEAREKEFQENLTAAKKLGESANVEVILANNLTEARTKLKGLVQQKLVTAEEANISGFKGADGGIITNDKTGKSYIVINKRQAIATKAVSVGSHEFLHKLMEKTLSNVDTQIELGKQLRNYLLSSNPELYLNEKVLIRLEGNYGNSTEGIKNEELLTVFSDALITGNVKYNESFFTKLGDTIRRYLQDLGLLDITFDSGRDVFNFIRDYNTSIQKGGSENKAIQKLFTSAAKGRLVSETKVGPKSPAFSKSIEDRMEKLDLQLSNNEIDWDKYELEMEKLEQEEFEESKKTYEEEKKAVKKETVKKEVTKKEPSEISEAANKAKAKLDAIGNDPKGFNPNNPTIYDELDKMVKVKSRNYKTSNGTIIDLTNKNKGGLDGFSMEEMTSYVTVSMLPYIQKFDPSRNDSLYGYINAQLANRMKAALKSGQVADVVFTEDVTEMTKLSNEDVEVKTPTLPERKKYQNILESGVFSPEVIVDVQAKILPIIRTLKSKVDEKTTLNRTTAPIINEIRTEIGKQADIDIKRAMGGKEDGQLRKFLLTNKKPVLENMTTTWLMGKDNGKTVSGGMPFAVQKRINGQWQSYPDWIGKKVDRESVETDLAGRTSGAELVRRLPNVVNNVTDDVFLDSIIDPVTGLPLRGRKEALAKALSEELTFDLISDDMLSGGPIYQALQKNQEILGAEIGKVTVENISRLAERGNIKYSLSADMMLDIENNSAVLGKAIANLTKVTDSSVKKILANIFADDWNENQIKKATESLIYVLKRNEKYFGSDELINYEGNTIEYISNISKEQDFGKSIWKQLSSDVAVAAFYRKPEKVKKLKELNQDFMIDTLKDFGDVEGTKILYSMWAPTVINGNFDISLFRMKDMDKRRTAFIDELNKARKTAFGVKTNNISEKVLKEKYRGYAKVNKVHFNYFDGTFDIKKDRLRTEAAKNLTIYTAKWWGENLKELEPSYQAAMFTLLANNADSVVRSAAPVVGIIDEGIKMPYVYEHSKPVRVVLAQLIDKYINKNDNITEDEIFENYKVLIVPKKVSDILDKSGVKQMMDPFYFIKDKTDFSRYDSLFKNNIIQSINIFEAQQQNIQNEKAALNNISQSKLSKSISTVSDFINTNNLRRLDTETSYELLDQLAKEIENYWGVVPNDVILGMNRAVDYAVNIIEDREGSGFLMAAVNDALNLETVKFAEKQLNEFVENNKPKEQQAITKFSLTSKQDLKWKQGDEDLSTKFTVGNIDYRISMIETAYMEYADDVQQTLFDLVEENNLDEDTTIAAYDGEAYNLEFWDKKQGNGITGTGNAAEVFGIVINGVTDKIKKKNIEALVFTAKEPSRIKLYNSMAEVVANKLGWNAYYKNGVYLLSKKPKTIGSTDLIDNNKPKETMYSKSLDFEFNDILERNTSVAAFTKVSDVVAKRTGIKKTTLSFFVPPSADDFRGLTTYMFAGKGKQGELDQEFFDKNLTIPYVKGINTLDSVRQSIRKEYKMLLNNFPDVKKKLEKLTPDKTFTYDQAVRVYLWNISGKEVPGLSRTDKNKLVYFVKQNPDLLAFANALSITGRQEGGWIDPSTTWDSETIISDLHNITEGAGRKRYLEEFIENADAIFTKENLNKIQSIYGTNVREAIEDSLYRMKNGKNRPEGTDRVTNTWMNWINGSTAAIMFFNTRSALLQTISAINFLNWNDNNPYMAGKAFLNQKQYWSDFAMIINSDKLKERRSGLKADVTQAEIANAANSTKNKFNGVISYLQKIGFTPTQAADSFSIAVSGATFYRNRVNTYLKAGDTVEAAEEKAFNDFSIITDQSMQSADPMYVSKQQTTALGRLILAFGNTPMQYNRLIKKATLDLANKRGDWKTNISKIVYYGALQNMLFSFLQSALFIPLGYDDEEEPDFSKMTKEEKKAYEKLKKKGEDKITNMINGMADTLLRGSGVYGAAIATVKNTAMEYFKQEEKEMFADHAYTVLALTSVSPPVSSKARKLYGAIRISKFEKDVIAERGWEITRDGKLNLAPNYRIVGNVTVATTNLPLDRVIEKVNNMSEVMDSRNTALQRTALALGWKDWELNVKNEENETIKATAKVKRKEEGIEKAVETRKANKEAEKEKFNKLSIQEKIAFRLKKAKEKREKRIKKRKMG